MSRLSHRVWSGQSHHQEWRQQTDVLWMYKWEIKQLSVFTVTMAWS